MKIQSKKIVFAAYSKRNFYCKNTVSEFILREGCIPINPFLNFDYFLHDKVERDLIRVANFNLVRASDELWVFGEMSDGVVAEIEYAQSLHKNINFYTIGTFVHEIQASEYSKYEDLHGR